MSSKNKKCCVCGNPTYGKGLSNDLVTCVCLNCARAIRDIMLQQERSAEARDYRQVVLPNNSCYIPPFPVNQNK